MEVTRRAAEAPMVPAAVTARGIQDCAGVLCSGCFFGAETSSGKGEHWTVVGRLFQASRVGGSTVLGEKREHAHWKAASA